MLKENGISMAACKDMKNICIAGANGLIGTSLSELFEKEGHQVRWLVRSLKPGIRYAQFLWDPGRGTVDIAALESTDVLINLAGSSVVGGLWTTARKEELLQSRVGSISALAKVMEDYQIRIPQIIQASAIGYYGNSGSEIVTESSPSTQIDFLPTLCRSWEQEAEVFRNFTETLTIVRTGLYFSTKGGMWPKMMMGLPFHLLPCFGDGKQMYSWIYEEDYANAFSFIVDKGLAGVVNMTSPGVCTQMDILKAVKSTYASRLLLFHIPEALLHCAPGGQAHILLDSCNAQPDVLLKNGFQFKFIDIQKAVKYLFNEKVRHSR